MFPYPKIEEQQLCRAFSIASAKIAPGAKGAISAVWPTGYADSSAVQHHAVTEIIAFLGRNTPAKLLFYFQRVFAAISNTEQASNADTVGVADIALFAVDIAQNQIGSFSAHTRQPE